MRALLPATLLLATALLATIGWEMQDAAAPVPRPASARSSSQTVARDFPATDRKDIVQGWVATTLERPLFRENRRPVMMTGDPARAVDEPLRLTGVITGVFGNRAIFLSAENPKPIVAQEGTRVEGFVVRTIQPGLAVLEGAAGNVRTLKPSFAPTERAPRRAQ
jgi:hypothetical protein